MNNSNSIYEFTKSIEDYDWVEYGFILITIIFFVTQIMQPSWFFFMGLIFAIGIIYYRIDQKKHTISTVNKELVYRLRSLTPRPSNFHMDADLINLFYNIKEFRAYNTEAYDQSLIAIDNMLKICSEIQAGIYHCKDNLDVVRDQANKAINHLHTVIYKSPIPKAATLKVQKSLKALQIILRRWIDEMVLICQKQYKDKPINIDTHFVYNKGPRPDDTQNLEYSNFDMYV